MVSLYNLTVRSLNQTAQDGVISINEWPHFFYNITVNMPDFDMPRLGYICPTHIEPRDIFSVKTGHLHCVEKVIISKLVKDQIQVQTGFQTRHFQKGEDIYPNSLINLKVPPALCSTNKKRISQSSSLGARSEIYTIWFSISTKDSMGGNSILMSIRIR